MLLVQRSSAERMSVASGRLCWPAIHRLW